MSSPLDRATARFGDKKILVFGLGLLGGAVGDARFFAKLGAKVTVTDIKSDVELDASVQQLASFPIDFRLGGHLEEDIWNTDYIIRNPSIPSDHPLLALARKIKKPILMRSSLFVDLAQIPVIGITGTRGKTTTTTMIYRILSKLSHKKVFLAGNISGMSDLELLDQIEDNNESLAVMELSSWQLQGFADSHISPHISVITNLYPDHLNRYPSLEAYYQDKRQILLYQNARDHAVLNRHQPEFHQWAQNLDSQVTWFDQQKLSPSLKLSIRGDHNRANAAAALSVAKILDLDEQKAIEILNTFSGVDYRLQTVAVKNNREFINDTTATTPVAAMAALDSLSQPPIIIVGGADKNLPIEEFAKTLNKKARKIILLTGTGTAKLSPLLDSHIVISEVSSMKQAVGQAYQAASDGDIILLSPGFASFGLFVNEFDRGEQFNQCVQNLE
jgi:UDP-N-acetylmuramoylalanine--D-glutamate ligase